MKKSISSTTRISERLNELFCHNLHHNSHLELGYIDVFAGREYTNYYIFD